MVMFEVFRLVITISSGSLALLLNAILAGIILTTGCNYIGKYKWLLFLYTVSAGIYAFLQLFIAGSFFLSPDGYIFYDSLRFLPLSIAQSAVCLFVSCFLQNLIILMLSFLYRYYAVCRPERLESFLHHYIRNAAISLFILCSIMAAIYITMNPNPYCQMVMGEEFFVFSGYPLDETGHVCAVIFTYGQLNWPLFLALAAYFMCFTVSGAFIVILSLRIGRALQHSTAESATAANNQKRIFTLLIFQLSLPVVFNIIPLQIVIVSTYLQLPTDRLVHCLGAILSFAQVVDPLIIFYFIKPYRLALLKKILCRNAVADNTPAVGSRNTAPF